MEQTTDEKRSDARQQRAIQALEDLSRDLQEMTIELREFRAFLRQAIGPLTKALGGAGLGAMVGKIFSNR